MNISLPTVQFGTDISECDREPIHIPGSIQPHGLLLIITAADQRVVAGAGRLETVFGEDWLGQTVTALLGEGASQLLGDSVRPVCVFSEVATAGWEGAAHRDGRDRRTARHRHSGRRFSARHPAAALGQPAREKRSGGIAISGQGRMTV